MLGYKPYQLAFRAVIAISFFWGMAAFTALMMNVFGIAFHHVPIERLLVTTICTALICIMFAFACGIAES